MEPTLEKIYFCKCFGGFQIDIVRMYNFYNQNTITMFFMLTINDVMNSIMKKKIVKEGPDLNQ